MQDELSPVGRFQCIVLATDGSEFSTAAETTAIEMAAHCGARLIVTRVVQTNPEYEALAPERVQKAEQEALRYVQNVARRAQEQGIDTETLIRHGPDPYQEFVRAADSKHADVIVIGRRARSDLARLMVGDSTAKVIGLANCNVMVVPRDTGMPTQGILVATDGSRLGDTAAYTAVRLVSQCTLPLTVVTVLGEDASEEQLAEAEASLQRVHRTASSAGIKVEAIQETGRRPEAAILQAAKQQNADMIIVGSHGRTGLSRLLMGSVSERVIGSAQCPVLVVKASV